MLKNDYLVEKMTGYNTAENEPYKIWSRFCSVYSVHSEVLDNSRIERQAPAAQTARPPAPQGAVQPIVRPAPAQDPAVADSSKLGDRRNFVFNEEGQNTFFGRKKFRHSEDAFCLEKAVLVKKLLFSILNLVSKTHLLKRKCFSTTD